MIDLTVRLFLVFAIVYIGVHVAVSMATPQLELVAGAVVVVLAGITWSLTADRT